MCVNMENNDLSLTMKNSIEKILNLVNLLILIKFVLLSTS